MTGFFLFFDVTTNFSSLIKFNSKGRILCLYYFLLLILEQLSSDYKQFQIFKFFISWEVENLSLLFHSRINKKNQSSQPVTNNNNLRYYS